MAASNADHYRGRRQSPNLTPPLNNADHYDLAPGTAAPHPKDLREPLHEPLQTIRPRPRPTSWPPADGQQGALLSRVGRVAAATWPAMAAANADHYRDRRQSPNLTTPCRL